MSFSGAESSGEEDFVDALEEPVLSRRARRVSRASLRQSDLDLHDLDNLLDAIAQWPSPCSLAEAWTPLPQLSLPEEEPIDSEDEFDPERTPRPPQRDQLRRSWVSEVEKTPPSLWVGDFPAPPPRSSVIASSSSCGPAAADSRKDSFFMGPGDDEEDDDWHSDAVSSPTRSSPTHSRNGSYERNAFRWSSSTTSTVLTMPSRSQHSDTFCDDIEEEQEELFTTAPLQIRRSSSESTRRSSIEHSRPPLVAPRLQRAHTDPPRSKSKSKEPEWNTLIDSLFGMEPRVAPRPPVWKERDLPAIPTLQEKRAMPRKASSASLRAAMSINAGPFPFLTARGSSLKKSFKLAKPPQSAFD